MPQYATPDEEALARFKECFGIQSAPIESAYQKVDRLTQAVSDREGERDTVQQTIDEQQKQVDALWEQYTNNKVFTESATAATRRKTDPIDDNIARLNERLEQIGPEIEQLKTELKEAQKQKRAAPKEATSKHIEVLDGRLKAVGLTMKDNVEATFKKPVNEALASPIDPEKVELAVNNLNARVEALCAPRELKQKQDEIEQRLTALGKQTYKNDTALRGIGELYATKKGDIKALTGEIELNLRVAELQSGDFAVRIPGVNARLVTLGRSLAINLEEAGLPAMRETARQLDVTARTALAEETLIALRRLEGEIDVAERADALAEPLRKTCVARFAKVQQAHTGFRSQSEAHKQVSNTDLGVAKGCITRAGNLMRAWNYTDAMLQLDDAQRELDKWNLFVLGAQEEQRLREEEEERERQEQEAQRLREEAMNVASLDAIGRDAKFRQWLIQAGKLVNAGLLTVNHGGVIPLNGQRITVEVVVTLTPTNPPDVLNDRDFVMHYHPLGDRNNVYGSLVHAKMNRHAPPFRNEDLDGGVAWLANHVPKLREV